MIDWSVRFGDILIIVSLAGSGIVYAFKSGRFAESISHMQKEVTALKTVAESLAAVLTTVAVQKKEIEFIRDELRELKHGDGWIQKPLVKEYP